MLNNNDFHIQYHQHEGFIWHTAMQTEVHESLRFETIRYFNANQNLLDNTLLTEKEKRKN